MRYSWVFRDKEYDGGSDRESAKGWVWSIPQTPSFNRLDLLGRYGRLYNFYEEGRLEGLYYIGGAGFMKSWLHNLSLLFPSQEMECFAYDSTGLKVMCQNACGPEPLTLHSKTKPSLFISGLS